MVVDTKVQASIHHNYNLQVYWGRMKPLLKFVNLKGRMGIYEQLKIEELFMRHQKENWYLLNTGVQQPSIVLGISGKVHELVNLGRCIEDDIPLIKRFSGGRPFVLMYST